MVLENECFYILVTMICLNYSHDIYSTALWHGHNMTCLQQVRKQLSSWWSILNQIGLDAKLRASRSLCLNHGSLIFTGAIIKQSMPQPMIILEKEHNFDNNDDDNDIFEIDMMYLQNDLLHYMTCCTIILYVVLQHDMYYKMTCCTTWHVVL